MLKAFRFEKKITALVGREEAIPPARRLFRGPFLARSPSLASIGLGKIIALAGQYCSKTLIVPIVIRRAREFSLVIE